MSICDTAQRGGIWLTMVAAALLATACASQPASTDSVDQPATGEALSITIDLPDYGTQPTGKFGDYLAGRYARNQGDWQRATELLGTALDGEPGQPGVAGATLIAALNAGQFTRALAIAAEVEDAAPERMVADMILAAGAMLANDAPLAQARLAALPADGLARLARALGLAWLAVGANDWPAAQAAVLPLAEFDGLDALRLRQLGLIADALGEREAVLVHLVGLERTGLSPRAALLVAAALVRAGNPEAGRAVLASTSGHPMHDRLAAEASGWLEGTVPPPPALTAATGFGEALGEIGGELRGRGGGEVALIFGRIGQYLAPDSPVAMLTVAELLISTGRCQDALDSLALVPADSFAAVLVPPYRARCLEALDRKPEAEAQLRQMVAEDRSSDTLLALGEFLRRADRPEDAAKAFREALGLGQATPAQGTIYYAYAMVLDEIGDWQGAEAALLEAKRLRPDDPFIANYLGYSWVDRGVRLDEGLGLIEAALRQMPRDGFITDSLGWAYFRLGRYDDAVVVLERAIVLEPSDPTINDHLGDAYWRVGRLAEARFQWQRALLTAEDEEAIAALRDKLERGLPDSEPPRANAAP